MLLIKHSYQMELPNSQTKVILQSSDCFLLKYAGIGSSYVILPKTRVRTPCSSCHAVSLLASIECCALI